MQNVAFNSALKSSASIRKDLSSLSAFSPSSDVSQPTNLTPAAMGALSSSITTFSRTIDEYNNLAKSELNPAKKEKALERIRNFRTELSEYRSQFDNLKAAREDAVHIQNRSELLGQRRPFATSSPNPYENSTTTATSSGYGHARTASASERGGEMSLGGDVTRESHALREQQFFQNTHSALDEYLARGQAVLGDLGNQRDMLKSTQRKLYSVGTTLGICGDTIRMIERRAREDKWIFWAGVIVFFLFCWLCLHFLR